VKNGDNNPTLSSHKIFWLIITQNYIVRLRQLTFYNGSFMPTRMKYGILFSTSLLAVTLGVLGLNPPAAQAMDAPCVDGNITLTVQVDPFNFGDIVPCAGAGAVSINAANGNVTTGGCNPATDGIQVRGQFQVSGSNPGGGSPPDIEVFISGASTTINSGPNNMSVTGLTLYNGSTTGTYFVQRINDTVTYYLGGTLNVAGTQNNGSYSGSIGITAQCP